MTQFFNLFGAPWGSKGDQKGSKLHAYGSQAYISSSLVPLSLSLSEVSVSFSSPLLPAKKPSSNSLSFSNAYFARSAENHCGRDACGGSGDGGVSSLHTGFCVIGAFRFTGFIS